MKILVFLHYYLPGYKSGGPLRTLANMVVKLPGLDFLIVTTDRDLGDTEPYPGIAAGKWYEVNGSQVFYTPGCSTKLGRFFSFVKLMRSSSYDVIYLNSYFDATFTLLPLVARRLFGLYSRPLVIAPRGEFSPGAISLKSWKKRPYLFFMKLFGLHRGAIWQASTEFEANDILRVIGGAGETNVRTAENIFIAPDISGVPVSLTEKLESDRFRVIFLSRISPKKNLKFALSCLADVKRPVEFSIYGPIEDHGYWAECQKVIETLPKHISVKFHGPIPSSSVPILLRQHDLFFFPTLGENFGHVIIESLSSGTPVLISDQTPWRTDPDGACIALPLGDRDGFAKSIDNHMSRTSEERVRVSNAAVKLAVEFSADEVAVSKNMELFRYAVATKNT